MCASCCEPTCMSSRSTTGRMGTSPTSHCLVCSALPIRSVYRTMHSCLSSLLGIIIAVSAVFQVSAYTASWTGMYMLLTCYSVCVLGPPFRVLASVRPVSVDLLPVSSNNCGGSYDSVLQMWVRMQHPDSRHPALQLLQHYSALVNTRHAESAVQHKR